MHLVEELLSARTALRGILAVAAIMGLDEGLTELHLVFDSGQS